MVHRQRRKPYSREMHHDPTGFDWVVANRRVCSVSRTLDRDWERIVIGDIDVVAGRTAGVVGLGADEGDWAVPIVVDSIAGVGMTDPGTLVVDGSPVVDVVQEIMGFGDSFVPEGRNGYP